MPVRAEYRLPFLKGLLVCHAVSLDAPKSVLSAALLDYYIKLYFHIRFAQRFVSIA